MGRVETVVPLRGDRGFESLQRRVSLCNEFRGWRRSGRGFAPVCVCPGKYRTRREDRPAHLIGATTEASDWYVAAQANNLEPVDDLVTSDRAPL